ncbi:MAG: hypothetical protein AB7S62_19660, partial [Azoarcus sp.]
GNHAHCALMDFGGVLHGFLLHAVHGSIFSRGRASTKPGAIQAEFQGDIILDRSSETAVIMNKTYKISDLRYVIEKSGREYIALRSKIPFREIILVVVKGQSD